MNWVRSDARCGGSLPGKCSRLRIASSADVARNDRGRPFQDLKCGVPGEVEQEHRAQKRAEAAAGVKAGASATAADRVAGCSGGSVHVSGCSAWLDSE
ncbi:hypothetical protein ACTMTF_42555 [Nonomuraea sp. ZG12]|uniref:hypothetical protein n=1 Tax=Nonomuraea sp. ZG12 TaxID=3452207 RepID=UPI003F8972E7